MDIDFASALIGLVAVFLITLFPVMVSKTCFRIIAKWLLPCVAALGVYSASASTSIYFYNASTDILWNVTIQLSQFNYSSAGYIPAMTEGPITVFPGQTFGGFSSGLYDPSVTLSGSYGLSANVYTPYVQTAAHSTATACLGGIAGASVTLVGGDTLVIPVSDQLFNPPAPTTTNITLCVNNPTPNPVQAFWNNNGAITTETLQPGQGDCQTFTEPMDGGFNVSSGWNAIGNTTGQNNDGGTTNDLSAATNSSSWLTNFPSGTSTLMVTNNNDVWNNSSNILWPTPNNSSLALDSTLRAGFGTLHNDNQFMEQDLQMLANNLKGITNIMTMSPTTNNDVWVQNWPSNFTMGPSNVAVSVNVSNMNLSLTNYATESTLAGISNLLASALTNGVDTNGLDLTTNTYTPGTYAVSSSDTDSVAAAASAVTDLGGVMNVIAAASNTLASALSVTVPDGSEPDMTVSFTAFNNYPVVMDLNPVHICPSIFAFAHAFFTWVLWVTFATGVINTLYEVLKNFAAAQTGTVPNLQGGASSGGTPVIEA